MKGLERKSEHYGYDDIDRKLEDKMNIALTRDERVLLWDLIGREKDNLIWNDNSDWAKRRIEKLKVLEILIIG